MSLNHIQQQTLLVNEIDEIKTALSFIGFPNEIIFYRLSTTHYIDSGSWTIEMCKNVAQWIQLMLNDTNQINQIIAANITCSLITGNEYIVFVK